MRLSTFITIIIVSILFIGSAVVYNQVKINNTFENKVGKNILSLAKNQEINKISINNKFNHKLEFEFINQEWLITNRWNYPADNNVIQNFITSLRTAKIVQNIRINEKLNTSNLLAEEANNNGIIHGCQINIETQNKKIELKLGLPIIQETANFKNYIGRHVQTNKDEIYYTNTPFEGITPLVTNWISHDYWGNMASINKIEIIINGKSSWLIQQSNNAFSIKPEPPKGKKFNQEKLRDFSYALGEAFVVDIADPNLSNEITGLDNPIILRLTDKNNKNIEYHFGKISPQGIYTKMINNTDKDDKIKKWIFIFDREIIKKLLVPHSYFIN